jgi:hypothetical protein
MYDVVTATRDLVCGSCIYGQADETTDVVICRITSDSEINGKPKSPTSFCGLGHWLVDGPDGIEPCDRPTAFFLLVNRRD